MRMTFEVSGLDRSIGVLKGFSDRRLNAAFATGLTRAANDIATAQRAEMQQVFDRPKPYTLGGVGVKTASANDLVAEVFLRTTGSQGRGAGKYLQAQVSGGSGAIKGFERLLQAVGLMPQGWRALPAAGARMDPYGNIDRQQLGQIITQLKQGNVGPQRKGFTRRAIGAARKAGGQFFAALPGNQGTRTPGIYIREFGGHNVTPVLIYVRTTVYKRRFDFYGIAARIAAERVPAHVNEAIAASAARLAQRGAAP